VACIVYDDMQGKSATNTGKGRKAELIARAHLVEAGWLIIDSNQYIAGGELDLIAIDPKKVLVFVEVKSAWTETSGRPQAQVHRKKQVYLWRAASAWIARHKVKDQRMRFDVIAIRMHQGCVQIEHLQDAFAGPSASY